MNKKRMILMVALALVLILGSVSTCFAATNEHIAGPTAPVPVNIATLPAAAAIDVTVSETVELTGSANSNALTGTNLELTNNGTIGVINISKIEATPNGTWAIVADSTDFTLLALNAKKISLMADSTNSMTAAYNPTNKDAAPKAKSVTTFAGKTGAVTTALSAEKVADITVTFGYKTAL